MNRQAGLLILGIAIVTLSGCGASNTVSTPAVSGITAEQTYVQTTLAGAPEVATDGLFDSNAPVGFLMHSGSSPMGGTLGGGEPETNPSVPSTDRLWWREINHVDRSFSYEFTSPDLADRPRLAHVVVHRHFTGTFHVAWAEIVPSSTGTDSVVRYQTQKPLADDWVRHLWLARAAAAPDSGLGHGWHVVAASGVSVTSEIVDAGAQPHIVSVRVQAGGQDSTFSDPAVAIPWVKLFSIPGGAPATVTVTTQAADDIVALMHSDGRSQLTANGDNTYTGTWNTSIVAGLKHIGINALSHASIFDVTAGYHSHAWLFPYVNRGEGYVR